jgi:membrane associated rhomboid family serine protease
VSNPGDNQTRVQIRRAPRFSVFLILGAVIGVIAAFVVTSISPDDAKISFGAVFGYSAIFGVTAGVLLAAIIALIVDRRSSRRAKTVTATIDRLQPEFDDEQTD